ncbi:MAG: phosphomannomutase [Deltaproteobacteria bacterium]|nr:phosphomannomutase [Deltaproteobacteria bacterium]
MTVSQTESLRCFKAYDVRGRIPDEFNEEMAYKIGRAYATLISPKKVCIGRDVRLSSEEIVAATARGLNAHGCEVIDIGLCPTEEIYFVTSHLKLDGGIMVTASHNPMDYNGMKFVREDSKPISADTGLKDMERIILRGDFAPHAAPGRVERVSSEDAYVERLLTYVDPRRLRKLKVIMNCGNGCAGPILEKLEPHLPLEFIKLFPEPDGTFPHGIPNPILPENRGVTAKAVLDQKADLGIAWDGDCDRCFFFDEKGEFLEGYYIVGFLAQAFLKTHPGQKIVHDPRLTWNTIEMVRDAGGIPVQTKAGHAFIKERMRLEDAIYGGEMSAHHYFREFAYCDSGMIPWLLMAQTLSEENRPLSELIQDRVKRYPVSGEINRQVSDPHKALQKIEEQFKGKGAQFDYTDGLSVEFDTWRFNLRPSNTEPVIRLNVEARGDKTLLDKKTEKLLEMIQSAS